MGFGVNKDIKKGDEILDTKKLILLLKRPHVRDNIHKILTLRFGTHGFRSKLYGAVGNLKKLAGLLAKNQP